MKLLAILLLMLPTIAVADAVLIEPSKLDPLKEYRYCGPPKRDAKGEIIRRADVIRAFRKLYPCPVTGQSTGACPGWAINHPFPLVNGGCDAVFNLDWMPTAIKSCARPECRDRWERDVYRRQQP